MIQGYRDKNPQIHESAFIAENATVVGDVFPAGKLARGVPARVVRDLTEEEIAGIKRSAESYCGLKDEYLRQRYPS